MSEKKNKKGQKKLIYSYGMKTANYGHTNYISARFYSACALVAKIWEFCCYFIMIKARGETADFLQLEKQREKKTLHLIRLHIILAMLNPAHKLMNTLHIY